MSKKFVRFCVPTLFELRELNLRSFANLIRQAEEADIGFKYYKMSSNGIPRVIN